MNFVYGHAHFSHFSHFSVARVLTSSEWQFSTVNGDSQERQSAPQPYPTAA